MQHLLIDECLSVELAMTAHRLGFRADHVVQRGWAGLKDWQLLQLIEQNGFLFVTNNRIDWLRLHGRLDLHDGLIIVVPSVDTARRIILLEAAMVELATMPDLINQVLEVNFDGRSVSIRVRPLAATSAPGDRS